MPSFAAVWRRPFRVRQLFTQALTPPWLPSTRPVYSQHPAVDTVPQFTHSILLLTLLPSSLDSMASSCPWWLGVTDQPASVTYCPRRPSVTYCPRWSGVTDLNSSSSRTQTASPWLSGWSWNRGSIVISDDKQWQCAYLIITMDVTCHEDWQVRGRLFLSQFSEHTVATSCQCLPTVALLL